MIFVTGANFLFKDIADKWVKCVESQSNRCMVYDLGYLGYGKKGFEETDTNFNTMGYYNSIGGKWKSTGLWKPKVILNALVSQNDNICYLDADALLMKPIEINFDFDVGVAERFPNPDMDAIKVMLRGSHNAGVVFLKNNDNVKKFVIEWNTLTQELGNDQLALNNLLEKTNLNKKVFSCDYNSPDKNGYIYHMAGNKKMGIKIRRDNI